ncbi:esterase/lipase family protein [Candidatus Mycobacterium methanotrophicum]|uniref:Alpha/beta hydrolase n=1 Tax=Candidatus Mycobacterium methanotrophicum TaxID=2943498 RepID=A0ABY4QIV2_9MYCO|nr:alpha/beta hydrolase [Candidatus Mycobacterium methanotrophicum]UQX10947.1 alpha/beta hydrolase [Candidatus Mycobacterium methanotrophicum]
MPSTPEPVEPGIEQSDQVPDAVNAAPPGHLLRALEWRTGIEYLVTLAAARRMADWPRGDGHPVLVIPGFLAGPFSTQLLRDVVRRLNYRVYDWGLGYNLGYRASMKETLPARLRHIRERADGRNVSVIGWSAGGIYARELARAFPDDVRSVITLGSPFRGNHRASTAWTVWRLVNRGSEATEAVSAAAQLRRDQPLTVPTTCIYSKSDGIVAWQCCTSLPAPQTENVEVHSSHLGYGHNVQTLSVIADRLAQPEGRWRPFRR